MYKKQLKRWGLSKRAQSRCTASRRGSRGSALPQVVASPKYKPVLAVQPLIESDGNLQCTLREIRNWVHGMVHLTKKQPHPSPTYDRSEVMYQTFTIAMELFALNLVGLAGKTLQSLFIQLERVLEEPSFDLLWNVFDMVYELKMDGHTQLLTIFVRHLEALTRVKFPAGHPMYRLIRRMHMQDSHQFGVIRKCHSDMLDELQHQLPSTEYRRQLHNSSIVRMQRIECLTPDPFIVGIWTLKKRSNVLGDNFANCWLKIIPNLNVPPEPLPTKREELQSLASKLVQDQRLDDLVLTYSESIIEDAKRRLAVIEMGTGGVLFDGCETEVDDSENLPYVMVEKGYAGPELHDWHEMLSIVRHYKLVGLYDDAELIKRDLEMRVSGFVGSCV